MVRMIHSNRFACNGFVCTCTEDLTPLADESLGCGRVADQSPSEWGKLNQPVGCIPKVRVPFAFRPLNHVTRNLRLNTELGVRRAYAVRPVLDIERITIGRRAFYARTRLRSRYSNATIGLNFLSRLRPKMCFVRTQLGFLM